MEHKDLSNGLTTDRAELRIPATAVSRGIGIGHVVFHNGDKNSSYKTHLDLSQIDNELERLRLAVSRAVKDLTELTAHQHVQSASGIFGVHLLILENSSFVADIESKINDSQVNAEWAIKTISEDLAGRQRSVSNGHLSEKHLDVKDVAERLMLCLGNVAVSESRESGSVLVVGELMPSRLLELAKSDPVAIISEHGGWTSHTSILARELAIPLVTGIKNIEKLVFQDDEAIIDGINGQIIVNPTLETLEKFSILSGKQNIFSTFANGSSKHVKTLDGHEILIRANADMPSVYRVAERAGASGIGLYRSEIIFNQFQNFPSEAEQITAYRAIADAVGDAGVRIRTFDVGVGQLAGDARTIEPNPSLGLKSIRLSLTSSDYFRTQIRAILQASHERKVDIVLPMISGVSDILALRSIIEEERDKLTNAGNLVGNPAIGVMIEVPSAVMTASEIARNVDFICLGTNDLVQYMLAVDRDNEAVADWYQTLHPAVIRVIRDVISAGKKSDIPVTICGEIAGSAFYVPLLIGLGACELSMNVISIQQIRHLISGITSINTEQLVESIELCETAEEIESILRDHYQQNWSHLFPQGLLSAKYP